MKRSLIVLTAALTISRSMYVSGEETDTPLNQEYAPLEKKAPIYPHITQFNGIEGYCIVEYTVTEQGKVERVPRGLQPHRFVRGCQRGVGERVHLSAPYR